MKPLVGVLAINGTENIQSLPSHDINCGRPGDYVRDQPKDPQCGWRSSDIQRRESKHHSSFPVSGRGAQTSCRQLGGTNRYFRKCTKSKRARVSPGRRGFLLRRSLQGRLPCESYSPDVSNQVDTLVGVPASPTTGISFASASLPLPSSSDSSISKLAEVLQSAIVTFSSVLHGQSAAAEPMLELRKDLISAIARIAELESKGTAQELEIASLKRQNNELRVSVSANQKQSSSQAATITSVVRQSSRTVEKLSLKVSYLEVCSAKVSEHKRQKGIPSVGVPAFNKPGKIPQQARSCAPKHPSVSTIDSRKVTTSSVPRVSSVAASSFAQDVVSAGKSKPREKVATAPAIHVAPSPAIVSKVLPVKSVTPVGPPPSVLLITALSTHPSKQVPAAPVITQAPHRPTRVAEQRLASTVAAAAPHSSTAPKQATSLCRIKVCLS